MKEESPAFQFYTKDFFADENVALMSLAALGAYIKLLCFCWNETSIPAEIPKLAKLCGTDAATMAELWPEIEPCFRLVGNRYIQLRLDIEREKQAKFKAERAATGAHGAAIRWERERERRALRTGEAGKTTPPSDNDSSAIGQLSGENGTGIARPLSDASSSIAKPLAIDGSSSSIAFASSSSSSRRGDDGGGMVVELAEEIRARRAMLEEAEREHGPADLGEAVRQALCLPALSLTGTTKRNGKLDDVAGAVVTLAAKNVEPDQVVRFAEWWKRLNPRKPLNLYFLMNDIWGWLETDQKGGSSYTNGEDGQDHRGIRESRVNSSRSAARSTVAKWGANASGVAGGAD